MGYFPEPDPATGLLPPGRYSVKLETLREVLVEAPHFTGSGTRKQLWDEWQQHRAIVEAEAGEITRLWLAGSFASGKLDPSDIDTTYLLRADVFDRLDRDALAALDDLTDKAWCVDNAMRIDAYLVRLPDEMPFWQMRPSIFGTRANEAFRDLGLYDEVWQCVRPSTLAGSHHGQSRQGYVEVLL